MKIMGDAFVCGSLFFYLFIFYEFYFHVFFLKFYEIPIVSLPHTTVFLYTTCVSSVSYFIDCFYLLYGFDDFTCKGSKGCIRSFSHTVGTPYEVFVVSYIGKKTDIWETGGTIWFA